MVKKEEKEYVADPMAVENRPDYVEGHDYSMPKDDNDFKPRIKVLQAISPECEEGNDKFIPNAKAGQILLEANPPRLIAGDEGVVVIPLVVRKRFAEYIPRSQGGGFVASYDTREEMESNFKEGNDVTVVIEYFVVLEETDEVFVVPFDSVTKLGVAKRWGGYVEQYETLEGAKYRIGAQIKRNKAQQSYYNFTITPVGWVEKDAYIGYQEIQKEEEPLFLPAPGEKEEYKDI